MLKASLRATVAATLLAVSSYTSAAECIGNCGTRAAVAGEVVTAPPNGAATYDWVSTSQGQMGGGTLAGYEGQATNGSTLVSNSFFAQVGAKIEFWFNYVTSDGAGFADYAWAQLRRVVGEVVDETVTLFTARTKPDGTIVPGTDLPGVTATLEPGSVPIIAPAGGGTPTPPPGDNNPPPPSVAIAFASEALVDAPVDAPTDGLGDQPSEEPPADDELDNGSGSGGVVWAPLGDSSGSCYAEGCGHTGWVKSTYTVQTAGTYQLAFGVTNWGDTALDSGMAFSGIALDGAVLGSQDNPLMPDSIGPNGEFQFTFTPTPNEFVFIDPAISIGYDYAITEGADTNDIVAAMFPLLAGDDDGYQIYTLGTNELLGTVLGGEEFVFQTAVDGFSLRGIDEDVMLDPTNPTAFVTGLKFANNSLVSIAQTPITVDTDGNAVPEPATWLLAMAGLAAVTARRRTTARVA